MPAASIYLGFGLMNRQPLGWDDGSSRGNSLFFLSCADDMDYWSPREILSRLIHLPMSEGLDYAWSIVSAAPVRVA